MKLPFMGLIHGAVVVAVLGFASHRPVAAANPQSVALEAAWTVPDVDKLPTDPWGRMVRLGRELTVRTYAQIGPEAADPAKRFAGNNLACQNCHLEAGTKRFALPFVGVFADFPQYRAREGRVGSLEDRINGCMERSMNGRSLPLDGVEMTAFVAYINFLSSGIAIGAETKGRGSGDMPKLKRAADLDRGKVVFAANCVSCHGPDGQGKRHGAVGDGGGYEFPPVWGRTASTTAPA